MGFIVKFLLKPISYYYTSSYMLLLLFIIIITAIKINFNIELNKEISIFLLLSVDSLLINTVIVI